MAYLVRDLYDLGTCWARYLQARPAMVGSAVRNARPSDEAEVLSGEATVVAFVVGSVERGISSGLSLVAGELAKGIFAHLWSNWDGLLDRRGIA